jgi:NodT family efflux transporter outer membrane factor (OMF) lipoprotein
MHGVSRRQSSLASPAKPCGVVFILALLLCGCTSPREYVRNGFKVGPNYAKPPAPVEENWIDSGDKRLQSQTPANVAWWTALKDPVLNNLIGRAYRENLTLRQAGYRVLEFRAQRAIAAGNLFPQTQQASGSFTSNEISRSTAGFTSAAGAAGAGSTAGVGGFALRPFFNTWDAGFNLAWEFDFWGRLRRAIESTDAALDASIEDYDNVLVTLIGDVANTYIQIRTFQTRIKLAQDNLALQRETYKIAVALGPPPGAGKTTKVDVDQALTNLSQVESLIPQLEIGLRQSENQLCILLGIPPQDLHPLVGLASIPKVAPEVVVGIPADLLRRRPDVRSAERLAAAQSAQIGIATAELYPHISITGTISWQAAEFNDLFKSKSIAGSVGPSFQWNILNYGRLVNGIRVQDARFQELVVSYQNVVLKAEAEVENGVISYLKSFQVVNSLAKGVAASEEGVKLATVQYREGKIPFVTLATLQQNLVTAQDQLATAYGNLVQSLIQTYRALGGGWQIRLQGAGPDTEDSAAPEPPNQLPGISPKDINPKDMPQSRRPFQNPVPAATVSRPARMASGVMFDAHNVGP